MRIKSYIHADRYYSKTSIVCYKRLVLLQSMALDKSSTDDMDEIPVEASVNE